MRKANKPQIMHNLKSELQNKIAPVFNILYCIAVTLVAFYILVPYLPTPVGELVTVLLFLSGLNIKNDKGWLVRNSIISVLKTLVKVIER